MVAPVRLFGSLVLVPGPCRCLVGFVLLVPAVGSVLWPWSRRWSRPALPVVDTSKLAGGNVILWTGGYLQFAWWKRCHSLRLGGSSPSSPASLLFLSCPRMPCAIKWVHLVGSFYDSNPVCSRCNLFCCKHKMSSCNRNIGVAVPKLCNGYFFRLVSFGCNTITNCINF